MAELLIRVEKYIKFEETLKFGIGIEVLVNELESDRAMKRKYEEDISYQHDKK